MYGTRLFYIDLTSHYVLNGPSTIRTTHIFRRRSIYCATWTGMLSTPTIPMSLPQAICQCGIIPSPFRVFLDRTRNAARHFLFKEGVITKVSRPQSPNNHAQLTPAQSTIPRGNPTSTHRLPMIWRLNCLWHRFYHQISMTSSRCHRPAIVRSIVLRTIASIPRKWQLLKGIRPTRQDMPHMKADNHLQPTIHLQVMSVL